MKHYVYVLTDNNIPFYVGRTNNLKDRCYKHKWNLKRDFEMNVIDTCDEYDIPFLEAFYITSYRQNGYKLINNKITTNTYYSCNYNTTNKNLN